VLKIGLKDSQFGLLLSGQTQIIIDNGRFTNEISRSRAATADFAD
jgi:uncharacterized membrane protein YcaP (DUF421 family)